MIIVIPARGGSKRLPHKNIHPLKGKPLLAHTLEAIAATGLGIPTYVSTDDEHIAAVARAYPGMEVVMRPAEIAGDTASTESVLLHVLDVLAARGQAPQWLMTLPPTSPFRTAATICSFAEAAAGCAAGIDCLMSVTENRGDFWRMQADGGMVRLFPDAPRRQQDRTPLFEENSAVYVSRTQALRATGFIFGRAVRGIPIPAIEGFDINNPEDVCFAECLYEVVHGAAN
ncbi:MAG: acylneuraminate cytidylyltransferase family protein [Coriobacteriales bacterium]|nr:acylneuraminate cytidylyltransferase family protein [Coriobacteriales bacterium]